MELKASKNIEVRFSEVDSMKVAWHGSYVAYFEDAREAFGAKYGLSYQSYLDNNCYAPIVDIRIQYKLPLRYGSKPRIDIKYCPCDAAKIIFEYEIRDQLDNTLYCTGRTVQVFMNLHYQLMWEAPAYYINWKKEWQQ